MTSLRAVVIGENLMRLCLPQFIGGVQLKRKPMSIFSFNRRERLAQPSRPAERFQMSENLEVAVWSAPRQDGTRRLSWALSRVNPVDPTRPFKTLRPEDLLEVPMVLAALASGFAQLPELAPEVREQLRELAKIGEPVGLPLTNGKDEAQKGILTSRVFGH
jgi:hypothetical protein